MKVVVTLKIFSVHWRSSRFVPSLLVQPLGDVLVVVNPVGGVESTSCGSHVTRPCRVRATSVRSSEIGFVRMVTTMVDATTVAMTPISVIDTSSSTRVKPRSPGRLQR